MQVTLRNETEVSLCMMVPHEEKAHIGSLGQDEGRTVGTMTLEVPHPCTAHCKVGTAQNEKEMCGPNWPAGLESQGASVSPRQMVCGLNLSFLAKELRGQCQTPQPGLLPALRRPLHHLLPGSTQVPQFPPWSYRSTISLCV